MTKYLPVTVYILGAIHHVIVIHGTQPLFMDGVQLPQG